MEKTIKIEYGGGTVPVTIGEEQVMQIITPRSDMPVLADPEIAKAVGPLTDFIDDGLIVVLINDDTRPTPNEDVLKHILPLLAEKEVLFVIASGTHKPPSDIGLRQIFGKFLDDVREKIIFHDCMKDLVTIGTTSRGTNVKINRNVAEADQIIIIGGVEPHYFAGFSGGRKSIVPGVAGYDTIEQNHSLALDDDSYDTSLKGNPVHEDLVEAVSFLDKPIYSIQMVYNTEHKILAIESRDIKGSFDRAVEKAIAYSVNKISELADIVVTVAPYPKDVDLYQAQQALEKGKMAVKKDGIVILVAKCMGGIGIDKYYTLLSSNKGADKILNSIKQGYKLGYHKAYRILKFTENGKIFLVSKIDDKTVKKCHMHPYNNIQKALDDALAEKPGGKIIFLMNGFLNVPKIIEK